MTTTRTTRAVNIRRQRYDTYIGRPRSGQPPSKWGNLFVLGHKLTDHHLKPLGDLRGRAEHLLGRLIDRPMAIMLYRLLLDARLKDGSVTPQELASLHGQDLGCFCKPQPCHGDVIAQYADWFHHHHIATLGPPENWQPPR